MREKVKETNTEIAAIFSMQNWPLSFYSSCQYKELFLSALHLYVYVFVFSINTASWLLVFDCNSNVSFLFPTLNERQFSCVPSCLMNDEMKVFSFFHAIFCVCFRFRDFFALYQLDVLVVLFNCCCFCHLKTHTFRFW